MGDNDKQPYPVEVTVKNWADGVAKPRFVRRTTLRTLLMDATGTVGPATFPFANNEPNRVRTMIQVLDNPVALLVAEAPQKDQNTTAVGQPAPQGLLLPPSLHQSYEFFGPDAMTLVALKNPSNVVNPALTGVVDTATLAVAATSAGSVNSPAPGESVSAFGVDFQAPGAAVAMQITLSNVLGGPYVYTVTVPTTGLIWRPPAFQPIPASSDAVYPTLAVAAQAGGPAYTLSLQCLKTSALSRVTIVQEYCD